MPRSSPESAVQVEGGTLVSVTSGLLELGDDAASNAVGDILASTVLAADLTTSREGLTSVTALQPAGRRVVWLWFVDGSSTAADQRVQTVSKGGVPYIQDLDVFDEVGQYGVFLTRIVFDHDGGPVTLDFEASAGQSGPLALIWFTDGTGFPLTDAATPGGGGGGGGPGVPNDQYAYTVWDTPDFSGNILATGTTVDIDYDWGAAAPFGVSQADNVSARFVGNILFDGDEKLFTLTVDDGGILFIDGSPVINKLIPQPVTSYYYTSTPSAGYHEVRVDWNELTEAAVCKLTIEDSIPPEPETGSRDRFEHPFDYTSPFNMPFGDGATFEAVGASKTAQLHSAGGWTVNCLFFSHPKYTAAVTDPLCTITWSGHGTLPGSYRVPTSATPAAGTDNHLHVFQVDGTYAGQVIEMYGCTRTSSTTFTGSYTVVDPTGPGWGLSEFMRAYGGSAIAGNITRAEMIASATDPYAIKHALCLGVNGNVLGNLTPVWPATSRDGFTYSPGGLSPMGQWWGIPQSVNVAGLGLNSAATAVAYALQRYGAFIVDFSGGNTIYVEPAAYSGAGATAVDLLVADADDVMGELRAMTNQSQANPGGPGTRVTTYAAPFAPL